LKKLQFFQHGNFDDQSLMSEFFEGVIRTKQHLMKNFIFLERLISLEKYVHHIANPEWNCVPDYKLLDSVFASVETSGIDSRLVQRFQDIKAIYKKLPRQDIETIIPSITMVFSSVIKDLWNKFF
jgi:hypothetical protein